MIATDAIDLALFLRIATGIALVLFSAAFVLMVVRIVRGPTLPDRIIALDMLVAAVVGFIATIAVRTGQMLYVDVAISLALVGFLSTVAFARFVLARGRSREAGDADTAGAAAHKETAP